MMIESDCMKATKRKLQLSPPKAACKDGLQEYSIKKIKCDSTKPLYVDIFIDKNVKDSVWDDAPYKVEIIANMLLREKSRRPFVGRSVYIPYRHRILQWLLCATSNLSLCSEVIELAIYFLDRYVDRATSLFLENKLELHVLVCLKLAAKSIEWENNIPSNCTLNNLLQTPYDLEEYVEHERKLLEFFQWNVTVPVVNTFLGIFGNYLIENAANATIAKALVDYKDYFEGVTLKYVMLQRALPSMVASSVIVASRNLLNVQPFWPTSLGALLPYRERDFKHNCIILINHLQNDTKEPAMTLKTMHMSRSSNNLKSSQISTSHSL